MKRTRICDLYGIEYPIVQGGMAHVSRAELAAAVSEAGALGLIGASTMMPNELKEEIRKARTLTSKRFGVNVSLLNPLSEQLLKTAIEENVKIIFTSAGNPGKFTSMLKEAGCIVTHVVANVKMALGAEKKGVDAVVCEGFEAGGHDGFDMLTTLTLTPQVVDAVKIPVISAGGITDPRGFVAAMALGAAGIQMGTRFVATVECNAHPNFKKLLVEAGDVCTVFVGLKHGPVRIYRNKIGIALAEAEARCDENFTVVTQGPGRGVKACIEGDIDEGMFNCSQAAGLIKKVMTCKEVIEWFVSEYDRIVKTL